MDHGTTPELPPPEAAEENRPAAPSRPSTAAAARHAKRLTLSFPVAPPLTLRSDQQQASPSVVVVAGTPATESPRMIAPGQSIPEALPAGDEPCEPADLLTAIASQERKVLELREELQKAEVELASLKKQWVLSERHKKQTEISHRAEAMRPLRPSTDELAAEESPRASDTPSSAGTTTANTTPILTPIDTVSAQIRRSKELERRNSIRSTPKGDISVSANGRRVFAGSKHTRTLSLLSPDMGVIKPPFPMKSESGQATSPEAQATRHPRSATLPSVERAKDSAKSAEESDDPTTHQDASGNQWRRSLPPPSSEALLRTGRQMASDLREGLWTFLEDIRQATVGEEAISATRTRTLQAPASTTQRSRSGQRSERSVTPVRNRDQQQNGAFGRTSSSSSLSKEAAKKSGNNISSPADIEVSFLSEFGVDTPGQKLERKTNPAADNTLNARKESEDSQSTHLDAEEEDDDVDAWGNWDTPQPVKKSHTPSSSQSTVTSKNDQSPSTQLSSPRTSASFGDQNTDEGGRHRTDNNGIPWPALSKFTASQLTRTASSLMDEWEKSLTSSSASSSSSSSNNNKADTTKAAPQKEQDEWEAF
ncbi:hypothetical protein UA08_00488 [Talaromyces atroroseus]|uniref:DUF4048 domain-containing protein n=1 Tax=Talaromyces atroroseus TaxID=1441469 RepID=A0A225B8Y5_TALAT|nr:hypothetical protein UA08_00488 [Talaromyces atroroseus]OKL64549.1 hypothetical protein UA08_00488 [Talaromyces atroroseus]